MNQPETGASRLDAGLNGESAAAYRAAIGKTIQSARVINNALRLTFDDGSAIEFLDDEPLCCEWRYMVVCDDPLDSYAGAKLLYAEIVDGPNVVDPLDSYQAHLVQFLRVYTSQGVIVVSNHNDGRYWSFSLLVRAI